MAMQNALYTPLLSFFSIATAAVVVVVALKIYYFSG